MVEPGVTAGPGLTYPRYEATTMLKILCAWHWVLFPEQPDKLLSEEPSEKSRDSYGICADCLDLLKRDGDVEYAGLKTFMA